MLESMKSDSPIGVPDGSPPGTPRRSLSYSPSRVRRYLRRYRLTTEGWLVIVIITLVGIAAWHSGTNLLYLMCSMLIGFLLTQSVLIVLCLSGLKVRRILPKYAYAAEETRYRVAVSNGKRFANSYSLRLIEHTSRRRVVACGYVARAPRHSTAEASMIAHFPERGLYTLGYLEVRTRYPFGLSERARMFTSPEELVVFPPRADVTAVFGSASGDFGEEESRVKGTGTQLYGLTEYTPGMHARRIHWRSSAKTNKLMVIEHERDELRKASVVLWNVEPADSLAESPDTRAHFEQAVTYAAGLARLLISEGYEVSLVTAEGSVPHGTGSGHLHRILRTLATIELGTSARPPARHRTHGGESEFGVVFSDSNRNLTSGVKQTDVRQLDIRNHRFVPRNMA